MKLRIFDMLAPVVIISCLHAGAADITFDFTSGIDGETSFAKTVSGYTLTFSNPSPRGTFISDGDGIAIGTIASVSPNVNQFQFVLTGGSVTDVLVFKNYEVGWVDIQNAQPFSLTGGTGTSTNNSLATTGIFNFAGPYSIAQGQTVILSSPGTTGLMLSQIKFMTFTVVPEPSTYSLSGIATATLAFLTRKRRKASA